jgi:transposase, IS605 OrfB family, central region
LAAGNQKISGWNHGKIRQYVEYKAQAEGIQVERVDERYSSQTCTHCNHRHKPRGRVYRCPACRFQSHRDVVGQINILSRYKYGEVGKIPAPTNIKHRIPHNLRVMRRRRDTGQSSRAVARGQPREAAGF